MALNQVFNNYLELNDIHVQIKFLGFMKNSNWNEDFTRPKYRFIITTPRGKYFGIFWDSIANQLEKYKNPTLTPDKSTILECLTYIPEYSDNPDDYFSFTDFCDYYGYDEHEKLSERAYRISRKEWQGICRIFTEDQINTMTEFFM